MTSCTAQQYPCKTRLTGSFPQTCYSSSTATIQVLVRAWSRGFAPAALRKCCTKYHPLHLLDYLCPLLPTSVITTLAQNSFITHQHHHNSLLTPCWCIHFNSGLQPEGQFLKASVIMSSPPHVKHRQRLKPITRPSRPVRSGLFSPSPPYPTRP